MYMITFQLEGLPAMTNKSQNKMHWRARHRANQTWYSSVWAKVGGRRPKAPLTKAKLTLIRYSSRTPDYDGLVASFKPIVDGLKKAGVLSDDNWDITGPWDVSWKKCPMNQGKVVVMVAEVENEAAPGAETPGQRKSSGSETYLQASS